MVRLAYSFCDISLEDIPELKKHLVCKVGTMNYFTNAKNVGNKFYLFQLENESHTNC